MGRAFPTHSTHRQPFQARRSRLLCATDLTARSERAVQAAALIANRIDGQLTLMHALEPASQLGRGDSIQAKLTEQLARTALRTRSIPALAIRRAKQPHLAISQVATEGAADLIVLGSQRRRALAPLLGTTAERVSASTARPVMIVNGDTQLRYDGVVIAADLTDGVAELLALAGPLGFLANGTVTIAHGFESPYRGVQYAEGYDVQAARREIARWQREAQSHFRTHLDRAGVEPTRSTIVVREMRPWGVVRRTLKGFSRPLLIIGTSAHTPLSRAVRGSLANDALMSLNCDVLMGVSPRGPAVSKNRTWRSSVHDDSVRNRSIVAK